MTDSPKALWQPANETELSMARAVAAGDTAAYFRILESCPLYLPGSSADRAAGIQRFVTRVMFGHTYALVFTSVRGLMAQSGDLADAYVTTTYDELRSHWPAPHWRLAINPGSPVDAYVRIEAVAEAARGAVTVPTGIAVVDQARADLGGAGIRPSEVEALLGAAIASADVDGYVHTLLGAVVIVPTVAEGRAEQMLEPAFPWRVVGVPEAPAIEVFTSGQAYTRSFPQQGPHVVVSFRFALTAWPRGCGLSVNPDGPSGIALPEEVVQMLQLWPTSGWTEP